MAETFENLEDILPEWTKKDIEESLDEAVDMYEKQEEQKTRFSEENDLEIILEKSQSVAMKKKNTKWVVKFTISALDFTCSVT